MSMKQDSMAPGMPPVLFAGGLVLGALVCATLLRGDAQGNVNLFYLLLYLVILPVAGLLLTLLFLRRDARGLAGLVLRLPFLPQAWSRVLLGLDEGARRLWFFLASQSLVLGLACGNILAYLMILLFRDVNFGWQSTLLDTDTATTIFAGFAWPWRFWEGAQVSEQLVLCTRVTIQAPLEPALSGADCHRQWWRYLLAAQFCYSLLPRGALCLGAVWLLARARPAEIEIPPDTGTTVTVPPALAPLQYHLDAPYALILWDAVPPSVLSATIAQLGAAPQRQLRAGPLATPVEEEQSRNAVATPVILLKGWEPPMARLGDYLAGLPQAGWLLPLDWEAETLQPLRVQHREEWQRFCALHTGWRVLQPEGL